MRRRSGGKSLGHVKNLGVKTTLESTPHFRVIGIKFSSPKGNTVRVALPEEDVQRLEAGYSLTRLQFDHLLFDRCQNLVRENGGKVIQGAKGPMFCSMMGGVVMTLEWEVETRDMPKVFNSQLVAGMVKNLPIIQPKYWGWRIPMPCCKGGCQRILWRGNG